MTITRTLTVAETIAALENCPTRVRAVTDDWGPHEIAEIEFDGEWLRLCRTDYKDDVSTSGRGFDRENPAIPYLEKMIRNEDMGGTRIRSVESPKGFGTYRFFSVIDRYSDG